ncbi:hypothetical protein [uncultured Erwinia sp.]|uniref:hypothetical protein n=1 Tax=uncultured Erwinia sp. TaxID=246798 RepID=UPI0025887763|nr:hypothetical protein [uncultured Erwinia sp.]
MMKKITLISLTALLLFSVPHRSYGYNLWVKEGNHYVTVNGRVEESDVDISHLKRDRNLYISYNSRKFGELGTRISNFECQSVQDAAKKINQVLSSGVTLGSAPDLTTDMYTILIICPNFDAGLEYWVKTSPMPIPAPECQVNLPGKVDFGSVSWGSSGLKTDLKGYVMCNSDSSGQLRLITPVKGSVAVGDATVHYAFDKGKSEQAFNATKYEKENFTLTFTLKDTGVTAGYKQASVVFEATWD